MGIADKTMDHTAYPKSLRSKDTDSVRFIAKDAKEAAEANPTNPNVGYYLDEAIYANAELRRRGA